MDKPPREPLSISVFFPCYNEEANVEATTTAALAAVEKISHDYEIIIVNDGSKDRTGEIADRLASRHDCVKAVQPHCRTGDGLRLALLRRRP